MDLIPHVEVCVAANGFVVSCYEADDSDLPPQVIVCTNEAEVAETVVRAVRKLRTTQEDFIKNDYVGPSPIAEPIGR